MHQVITRPPGELVLISLAFGADLDTMIADLRGAGWPRVLALARGRGTGVVIEACHRGVSGVLRGPSQGIAATTDRGVLPDVVLELSARGIEVLQWVADGRSNTWIAEQLHVSPDTVKSHLARIGRKLGTSHRAHMIAVAMRAGIIG